MKLTIDEANIMSDFERNWSGNSFIESGDSHPYYIVAHAYTRKSAGIRVLHLLCNALNRSGQRAYLIVHPQFDFATPVSRLLNTPLLSKAQMISDFERGLTPITVYPEMIGENLYNAPVAFEYLLNFKGLLGGPNSGEPMPQIAYSEQIRLKNPNVKLNLFIPTSDPRVFCPPKSPQARHGTYFYAAKFQSLYGKIEKLPERNMIEILRNGAAAQSVDELVHIYQTAYRIYVYENTAVATEAAMCGCPVVFMPSEFLDSNITEYELGNYGMAWGNNAQEIQRAEMTVGKFYNHYLETYAHTREQLDEFIEYSQLAVAKVSYKTMMNVPHLDVVDQWMRLLGNTYGFTQRVRHKLSRLF